MTPEIPTNFLRRLIAIGETNNFSALPELFSDFPPERVGHFMRQRPDFWYSIADSIPEAELEALVRAITIAERDYPEFGGGSVSGVIWAFRRLQHRTHSNRDTLADWILAHTNNPWAPFGSSNLGARSLAEFQAIQQRAATARIQRAQNENERQAAVASRIANKATHDIFAAIRRKDIKAVQALLLRGARLDVSDDTGKTAMVYAQSLGHAPIIELLRAHANGLPPYDSKADSLPVFLMLGCHMEDIFTQIETEFLKDILGQRFKVTTAAFYCAEDLLDAVRLQGCDLCSLFLNNVRFRDDDHPSGHMSKAIELITTAKAAGARLVFATTTISIYSPDFAERVKNAGADFFLYAPFDFQDYKRELERCMASR